MPSLLEDIALSCACFSVKIFYHTSWGICDPKARKPSGVKCAVLGSSITLYSVKFSKLIFLFYKSDFSSFTEIAPAEVTGALYKVSGFSLGH